MGGLEGLGLIGCSRERLLLMLEFRGRANEAGYGFPVKVLL